MQEAHSSFKFSFRIVDVNGIARIENTRGFTGYVFKKNKIKTKGKHMIRQQTLL